MPPSAADIACLRGNRHTISAVLNAVPLVSVATAQIAQSTFTYPLGQVSVDNTSADWLTAALPGMAFAIGTSPGAADVTWGVVRKTPTASIFYMSGMSLGDPGYARAIHTPIQDNYYVTVYSHFAPWGMLSRLVSRSFFKAFDLAYSGQGAAPDPIIRLGAHQQAFIDPVTGLATFTLSAADSYYWNKANDGYQWTLPNGCTLIGGSLTGDSVTFTAPPGFYVILCEITSTSGRTRLGYRYVWANSRDRASEHAPFSWRHPVRISGDTQDLTGRRLSIDIDGVFDAAELYPGQAFLLSETATYDGETLDDPDVLVSSFIGYAPEKSVTITRRRGTTTLELENPLNRAQTIPTATQIMTEAIAPSNWTECTALLSNPVGAAWYIMAHHAPYLIDGHDFEFDTTLLTLRRKSFVYQSVEIGSQLSTLSEMFLGNIGCLSAGGLLMKRNPLYMTNAERNALNTRWTWEGGDFTNAVERQTFYRMQIGQVMGYAFSYAGGQESTPYQSLAPGSVQAQGIGQEQMTACIVTASQGQTEVNRLTGHHFARVNNPTANYTLEADRNLDIAEPCVMDWHVLNIPATYDPEGEGFTNERAIPVRVSRNWSSDGSLRKSISVEFQRETFGQPGITIPVNRGGANTYLTNVWTPGQGDQYAPAMPELGLDLPVMLAGNSAGYIGRSISSDEPTAAWERLS